MWLHISVYFTFKDVQTETLQRIIRSTNDDAEFIFVEISDGSVAMKLAAHLIIK